MNTQFMLCSFMLVLVITLAACQPSSVVVSDAVSKGEPHSQNISKFQLSTNPTCWKKVSKHGKKAKTFILAMGANTGKLRKANQDARQFKNAMQKRFNVPSQQVCFLKNVYRNQFEKALKDLKGRVKKNDRVIIFFSGHGSYVKDQKGGEESDHLDDVLITLDVRNIKKPKRNQVITDDRLVQLVNALPTRCILTFIDACHAGGMYMKPENGASQTREKFFAKGDLGTFPRPLKAAYQKAGKFARINGVVFAAAKESQKAWEDNTGGIFTTIFLKQLKRHPKATLNKIFNYTAKEVRKSKRTGKPQHPQLIKKNSFCEN
jgi:hypothetical protein